MNSYLSIIRGINVGGHNKIKMEDLRKLYEQVGFRDVETYIQSGNVLFRSQTDDRTAIISAIQSAIKDKYGYDVATIIRTNNEFQTVIDNNPFSKQTQSDHSKILVTFLSAVPPQKMFQSGEKYENNADYFVQSGSEIYLHCPNGYGRTKLTNTWFEKKLNVVATTRNWKTVLVLKGMIERSG